MKQTGWRLIRLAAPFAGWMALALLLGVLTVASGIGLMTTSAYLIARAALQPSIADLQVAIVGVRFFGIARGLFRYLERLVSHEATFRLLARLRTWFYRSLEPLAPARLAQARSGDLLARIVADIDTLENLFLRALAPPAVALLVTLLATGLMVSFDPRLAAALLAFLLLAGLALPLLAWALSRRAGPRLVQVRGALTHTLVEGVQGMPDLVAFGQESRHLDRVRDLDREMRQTQGEMARITGLHSALSGLLMHLAVLAVLALAIPLVRSGRLDGVYLALLALAVISSFEAVLPLPQAFQYLGSSLEAGRRLLEIVDTTPAVVDSPASALPAPPALPAPTPAGSSLLVEGLCFAYGPGERPALDGISFAVPAGGRVAIVGPSGAGKSTLANLLLRFWDYAEGQIWLAGQELRQVAQEEVRRQIAVVSQEPHLFNASVRDNLLLARPDAGMDDLIHACRLAQIHDWIESLPEGYDTWIGELGVRLSAGQRQRLAVARALLKDAPLLILDEPTANLDALTAREVMAALQPLMAGRTTLLITHHLVGLEAMDEILVLRAGRIAERGRHHELMEWDGLYRRMWNLQRQTLGDVAAGAQPLRL